MSAHKLIAMLLLAGLSVVPLSSARAQGERTTASEVTYPLLPNPIPASCLARLQNEDLYEKEGLNSYKILLPGKDGWIFRTQSDFTGEYDYNEKSAADLKLLQDHFEERGTTLVIAYPPTRGMMAAEFLPGGNSPYVKTFDAKASHASYVSYIQKLRAAGIHVVGIEEYGLGDSFFRKADHHWNVKGARLMAEKVSAYVRQLPVYSRLEKKEFKTISKGPVGFDGRYNHVYAKLCGYSLPKEMDTEVFTVPAKSDESALFADEEPPEVVLVGTSNSKGEKFNMNFDGALKETLSADVHNAAQSGMGFENPMLLYVSSKEFRENPPRLIIWEIPGYYTLMTQNGRSQAAARQIIPTMQGECGRTNLASTSPVKLTEKKSDLFKDLSEKNIVFEKVYLHLKFSKNIKKQFSVSFEINDKTRESFKFKPTRRFANEGAFFYAPGGEKDKFLSGVSIKVPEEMLGLTVEARLCKLEDPYPWYSKFLKKSDAQ